MEKQELIEKLYESGAHFGYAPSRRHPSTAPFIFGQKGGTELIDLEQTYGCLESALNFIKSLAAAHKVVLFVGGKAEARGALQRAAEHLGQPYVASRWIGGTLTNFQEIKKRLARLQEIGDMRERGEDQKFTKHERLLIEREAGDLERMFGGLKGMSRVPDTLVVVDPKQESGAVAEATQLNIPVVAVMNTDCDRSHIQYPIPANDASAAAVSFILDEIAKTYSSNLGPATPVEPGAQQA